MGARGYVVRGKHKGQHAAISDVDGTSPAERKPNPFATINEAVTRVVWLGPFGWSDVAIFRVHDDGREERLPSYEAALGEIERLRADVAGLRAGLLDAAGQSRRLGAVIADPLAALEAAEHRLLEAGGWTETKQDRWTDRDGEYACCRDALTIERRRLAAKGGA